MSTTDFRTRVTVAAIVEREGRFLLVEERTETGALVWNQPAGHLDPGETLAEAAVREALEETGYRFVPESLVGVYLWKHPGGEGTYLRTAFGGRIEGEPNGRLDPDIVRTHWRTRAELAAQPEMLRSPLVLRCVDDWLAGVRHPLDLVVQVGEP